jgi:N-acetylmuramoyl-L-alanine amidase
MAWSGARRGTWLAITGGFLGVQMWGGAATAQDGEADFPGAVVRMSPHADARPAGAVIDTIVLHDTETPGVRKAEVVARWFLNPTSGVSAHYIIGKDGEVVQCVREADRAFHAGPSLFRGRSRVNDFSIGVELVNGQTGSDPFPAAQMSTLVALVRHLCVRWAIPADRVVGHHDITLRPHLKRDPAPNFPWPALSAALWASLPAALAADAAGP